MVAEALNTKVLAREGPGIARRALAPLHDPALSAPHTPAAFRHGVMAAYDTRPMLEHPDERERGDPGHDSVEAALGAIVALPHLIPREGTAGVDDWPATRGLLLDLLASRPCPARRDAP